MTIEKNASNQSGGSIDTMNSVVYTSTNYYGRTRKVTTVTKEYVNGKLVKETSVTTEYDDGGWYNPVPYSPYPYPYYQPIYCDVLPATTASAKVG